MNIGPTELLIFSALAALVVVIWAIVDAAGHPSSSWDRVGKSKSGWIAMMAGLYPLCGIGLILAIVYLASIRPELVAADTGGPAQRRRSVGNAPSGEAPGASAPPANAKTTAGRRAGASPGEVGYCSQCGGRVEPNWKHCANCGSPVVGIPKGGT